jgi:tight adherence protein B
VATLLRDRLELQREVRSVTAQGRLSGWVIGALVPVSAGILLTFNPQYIKILFDTLIGQLVLVTVILLQIIGWVLISRLIRIRY